MIDDDRYEAALGKLLELTVLLGEDMQRTLAAQGLTVARAHLLFELAAQGPSTQQTLAAALNVSPRNITGLVDGLEATGFVRRQPHPNDRRATLVTFTEHGTEVVEGMQHNRDELAELLFASLPDQVFHHLMEGLDIVLGHLHRALADTAETR